MQILKLQGNITYLLKWLKLKKSVTISNEGRDTEKLDNLHFAGRKLWRRDGGFFKTKYAITP